MAAIDSAARMDVAPSDVTHTVVMALPTDRPTDLRMVPAALGPAIRNSRCIQCLSIHRDFTRCRSTVAGTVDTMDIIIAIDELNQLAMVKIFRVGNPDR